MARSRQSFPPKRVGPSRWQREIRRVYQALELIHLGTLPVIWEDREDETQEPDSAPERGGCGRRRRGNRGRGRGNQRGDRGGHDRSKSERKRSDKRQPRNQSSYRGSWNNNDRRGGCGGGGTRGGGCGAGGQGDNGPRGGRGGRGNSGGHNRQNQSFGHNQSSGRQYRPCGDRNYAYSVEYHPVKHVTLVEKFIENVSIEQDAIATSTPAVQEPLLAPMYHADVVVPKSDDKEKPSATTFAESKFALLTKEQLSRLPLDERRQIQMAAWRDDGDMLPFNCENDPMEEISSDCSSGSDGNETVESHGREKRRYGMDQDAFHKLHELLFEQEKRHGPASLADTIRLNSEPYASVEELTREAGERYAQMVRAHIPRMDRATQTTESREQPEGATMVAAYQAWLTIQQHPTPVTSVNSTTMTEPAYPSPAEHVEEEKVGPARPLTPDGEARVRERVVRTQEQAREVEIAEVLKRNAYLEQERREREQQDVRARVAIAGKKEYRRSVQREAKRNKRLVGQRAKKRRRDPKIWENLANLAKALNVRNRTIRLNALAAGKKEYRRASPIPEGRYVERLGSDVDSEWSDISYWSADHATKPLGCRHSYSGTSGERRTHKVVELLSELLEEIT